MRNERDKQGQQEGGRLGGEEECGSGQCIEAHVSGRVRIGPRVRTEGYLHLLTRRVQQRAITANQYGTSERASYSVLLPLGNVVVIGLREFRKLHIDEAVLELADNPISPQYNSLCVVKRVRFLGKNNKPNSRAERNQMQRCLKVPTSRKSNHHD